MLARASAAFAAGPIVLEGQANDFTGTAKADWVEAYAVGTTGTVGNDLRGGRGNDILSSFANPNGPEGVTCETTVNTIFGGRGADSLHFFSCRASNTFNSGFGGSGSDSITMRVEDQGDGGSFMGGQFHGGYGADSFFLVMEVTGAYASTPFIHAFGDQGRDTIRAILDQGRAVLAGGSGADRISVVGGDGNAITPGRGNDRVSLGDGADVFRFNKGHGRDVVTGWDLSVDQLALGSLQPGEAVVTDNGADVVIAFGADAIRFVGIGDGTHDLGDFLLV